MHPELNANIFGKSYILNTYPLFGLIAIVSAGIITFIMLKKTGYKARHIFVLFLLCAVFFLVGARLLNFLINYDNYISEGYSVFSLSFGHFSVYGGMIFAAIPPIIFIKVYKKNFWLLADTMTFPFLISFAIMRMGCFLNGCCYGIACDNFLGVPAPLSKACTYEALNKLLPNISSKPVGNVYPAQLMEMGFALLFLPLGIYLYRKFKGRGFVASILVVYFSAFRLFVLYFRELPYTDTVIYVVYPIIYNASIVVGIFLFVYNLKLKRKKGI